MVAKQGLLLLSIIFILSWIYKTYVINIVSNIISIPSQCMILMFISILTQLDNITLYYDLKSKNDSRDENDYYIKVIGNQAIQLEKNKIIIYNLIKINDINNIETNNNNLYNQKRLKHYNSL